MNTHTTREGWLAAAALQLEDRIIRLQGAEVPKKIAYSCGFPKGGGGRAIGQCWDPTAAPDETHHIFICPTQVSATRVLDILLHEIIHAVVGIPEGHRGKFKKMARAVGLEGKLTATVVSEGTELHNTLVEIADALGPYPHGGMRRPSRKPAASGWVRVYSPQDRTYSVVISPKSLDAHGAPIDPWGNEMELDE